ncbi:MAG: hypothetical protein ACI9MB_001230, partial [Verrucomicrobiales bacterium]
MESKPSAQETVDDSILRGTIANRSYGNRSITWNKVIGGSPSLMTPLSSVL